MSLQDAYSSPLDNNKPPNRQYRSTHPIYALQCIAIPRMPARPRAAQDHHPHTQHMPVPAAILRTCPAHMQPHMRASVHVAYAVHHTALRHAGLVPNIRTSCYLIRHGNSKLPQTPWHISNSRNSTQLACTLCMHKTHTSCMHQKHN